MCCSDCRLTVDCIHGQFLPIKSEPASSVNKSRRVDKQHLINESASSLAVSSSRRRQHHMGKSSCKRPAEVSIVSVFCYCVLIHVVVTILVCSVVGQHQLFKRLCRVNHLYLHFRLILLKSHLWYRPVKIAVVCHEFSTHLTLQYKLLKW